MLRLRQPETMSASDAVAGVATTGFAEMDETRAFNRQLAELVATIPTVDVVDDPVKIRAPFGPAERPMGGYLSLPSSCTAEEASRTAASRTPVRG
jgi:hypothetical protein